MDRIEAKRRDLWGLTDRVAIDDFGSGNRNGSNRGTSSSQREVEIGSFYKASRLDQISSRVLFELVRELRPTRCVELGTCTGLSAAYQAAALELNGSGKLLTIEGDATLAERAAETLRSLELSRVAVRYGPFETQLPLVCDEQNPVDYVFNDGHHLEEPTVRYYETLLPCLAREATVVLDDINWSQGMRSAWKRLSHHPSVAVSVDLYRMGVLRLVASNTVAARHYRWTSRQAFPWVPES
jgi:predicted O-methyltransferase YrrM